MADLSGQTIASSYEQLLSLPDGGGNANTLVAVTDGDAGTTFGIKLATNKVEIIPGSNDANAFEVSQADGTAVFTVNTSTVGATISGDVTITSASSGKPELTIKNTNDDAEPSYLKFVKDTSTSAADNDEIAKIEFFHDDDGNNQTRYGAMIVSATDTATSSEDSKIRFLTRANATDTETLTLESGKVSMFSGGSHASTAANAYADNLVIRGSNDGDGSGITIFSETDEFGTLYFGDGGSGADAYRGYVQYSHSANELQLGSDGSTRLIINSSGTVSIGSIADEGNAIITNGVDAGRYDVLTVQENGNERWNLSFEGNSSTNSLTLNSNASSNIMHFAAAGNVGIGTASPTSAKLQIESVASGDMGIQVTQSQAEPGIFIDQNGNGNAVNIDHEGTTASCFLVDADALTTGSVAKFQSNSSTTNARNLVTIINDHSSATGAIGLYIQNDASAGAELINGYSDARHFLQRLRAGNSSYDSAIFMSEANRTANANYFFYKGQSDADGTPDLEFSVTGVGEVQGDTAYATPTSDYAEYFESKDGSTILVGTTVKLDGEKIVACKDGDTPIGVIRPNGTSSVVGNNAWNRWKGKYLKDSYGAYLWEEYSATTWEEGDDKKYYHSDRIPSSVTVPSDAVVTSTETDGSKLMRKKLNPDWDESKTYVSREDRDEWNIVGLMGQVEITKGQPVASNWIKMKDISDTVELWFIK